MSERVNELLAAVRLWPLTEVWNVTDCRTRRGRGAALSESQLEFVGRIKA